MIKIDPQKAIENRFATNRYTPIWDQYVLANLSLELEGKSQQEKLYNAIKLYDKIEKRYADYMATDNAKECIDAFNRALLAYQWLSNIKKIEFFLWSLR